MIIYKTMSLLDRKIYVGKACGRNVVRNYLGSGVHLRRAIKKYGENNFNRITIDVAENRNDQNLKEKFWIAFYSMQGYDMYNIAPGGEGGCGKHSEQTKQKMSFSALGRIASEATKQRLRSSHVGLKQSVDTIQKRVEKTRGLKRTAETKLKISSSLKGKPSNFKGKSSRHKGRTWIVENGKRLWKDAESR